MATPRSGLLALLVSLLVPHVAAAESPIGAEAQTLEFFEKHVRPILVSACYTCHSADTNSRGGLRVDDLQGLLQGGASGPAVVRGKPDESLLISAIRYADPSLKMPPEKQLAPEQIAILTAWIEHGAVWPQEVEKVVRSDEEDYDRLRAEHWAWQPLRDVPPPEVRDAAWIRSDIDRFLLARLETADLPPVRPAERWELIRRVTFDLTGLPPAPAEVEAFLQDPAPDAFEKLVDRLLASPAYGERWGRHWLDVARYGESTGSSRNLPYPHAWRYRDYVLRSFQADKPYDQFLREQIAGDLLPAATPALRDEQLVATGFLAIGVKDVNQRFKVRYVMDNIDEQIDAVSRSVLALTVSCARCHNHKFDPIPQADYYALAGIFHSTDLCAGLRNKMGGGGLDYYDTAMLLPLGETRAAGSEIEAKVAAAQEAMKSAQAEVKRLEASEESKTDAGKEALKTARQAFRQRQAELTDLQDPAMQGPVALGVREGKVGDTQIRIRGEAERIGPTVPRGFLSVLPADAPAIAPEHSGRLELAQWLTSPQNPLTPRVMVNRVWQHLFGQGLVRSVDNFGSTGDAPSHPELLDHLARRFVADGWSVKSLVRAIVLSHAYQLSSDASELHLTRDPENRLVWRHRPRRLEAEEIRDAMLALAGNLESSPPAGSPAQGFKVIELDNNSRQAQQLHQAAFESLHRSVYLPLVRGVTPIALDVFDFAEQGMVTGCRNHTTVAPQALYMLNDPFVRRQADLFAQRLIAEGQPPDERVRRAYQLALGRAPRAAEIERAVAFVADYAETSVAPPVVAASDVGTPTVATNDNGEKVNHDAPPQTAANGKPAPPPPDPARAAWASFCQALLGSAEFRYVK